MRSSKLSFSFILLALLGTGAAIPPAAAPSGPAIIVNHNNAKLAPIPSAWINQAKQTLHIAYGHTSHGSQLTGGMAGLVTWKGSLYSFNSGGTGGALDLRD